MDITGEALKAIATAILAALSTWGFGHFVERKPKTVHLAIRIATTLERFAIDCSDVAEDIRTYVDTDAHMGAVRPIPSFPEYPADTAWSLLDKSLAERALTLPNRLRFSVSVVQQTADVEDVPHDQTPSAKTTAGECGRLGLAAWKLAADIRRKYRLPQVDPNTLGQDVPASLTELADRWREI